MAPLREVLSMLVGQAFGKTWIPDIDLKGKTVVVTGANTGLGFECAKHLARLNASHIILGCRNTTQGQAAADRIIKETGCNTRTRIEVWKLDLAEYASVLAFCSRIRSTIPRLDAFIANAGMEVQEFQTAEGLEKHLTVNVVSTLLSGIAVLPKLRETAKEHGVETTLTFCGSIYHIFGPDNELDVPDEVDMFEALSDPAKSDIIWRYALSKLMVHQCVHGLVDQLSKTAENDQSGVVINFVNPGWCSTELSRAKAKPVSERISFALIGWTAEKGSRVYIHAMAAGKESHGRYLSECQCKPESQFVRSERGRRIQEKMWKDLVTRIERISPEVVLFIR